MVDVTALNWNSEIANPVFNDDRSKPAPQPKQDPGEFWTHLKEHTVHIHVKDAIWDPAKNDADYTLPGKGDGAVRRILTDAITSGYDQGISIEPHLAVVFHDDSVKASDEEIYESFVDYGKALMALVESIKEG